LNRAVVRKMVDTVAAHARSSPVDSLPRRGARASPKLFLHPRRAGGRPGCRKNFGGRRPQSVQSNRHDSPTPFTTRGVRQADPGIRVVDLSGPLSVPGGAVSLPATAGESRGHGQALPRSRAVEPQGRPHRGQWRNSFFHAGRRTIGEAPAVCPPRIYRRSSGAAVWKNRLSHHVDRQCVRGQAVCGTRWLLLRRRPVGQPAPGR